MPIHILQLHSNPIDSKLITQCPSNCYYCVVATLAKMNIAEWKTDCF